METSVDSAGAPSPPGEFHVPSVDVERQRFHVALSHMNRARLEPGTPRDDFLGELEHTHHLVLAEYRFLERERRGVRVSARSAPSDPARFVAWFEELRNTGPGQFDPLFDYLAEACSFEELQWFIRQEVAGEAGFDDLVALAQIRMPEQAKLELARNYWDEMGRGQRKGTHGSLLARLADVMGVANTPIEDIAWESLALSNLLVGFAYNRQYAFQAIGALGVIELTSTTRAPKLVDALDRLGIAKAASYYFRLHATVDIGHWQGWRDNIVVPLVAMFPDAAVHIAEGALARLNAGARTFDRYRKHLDVFAEHDRNS
jgi:hypothetical protein